MIVSINLWSIIELETMIMFDDNNFDDTDATDATDGELTLDEIDQLGLHPDLSAVADEFAQMINGLAWPMRKALDEMFGRAMLRGLEIGQVAGRFDVQTALRF